MLLVMMYEGMIFIAIALGLGTGYFIVLRYKRSLVQQEEEECDGLEVEDGDGEEEEDVSMMMMIDAATTTSRGDTEALLKKLGEGVRSIMRRKGSWIAHHREGGISVKACGQPKKRRCPQNPNSSRPVTTHRATNVKR